MLAALLIASTAPSAFLVSLPAARPTLAQRNTLPVVMEDTSGKGFGKPSANAEAEARGRKMLEEMRASSSISDELDSAFDNAAEENIVPPLAEEGSSPPTLGVAGFLLIAGALSLVVGGPLWEDKGSNDDGSQPDTPAFGFAPTAMEKMAPEPDKAPTWAD